MDIAHRTDTVAIKILVVIVISLVQKDISAPKEMLKLFECRQVLFALCDDKLREYLPPEFCGLVAKYTYRETPFSVRESDDPLLNPWFPAGCLH